MRTHALPLIVLLATTLAGCGSSSEAGVEVRVVSRPLQATAETAFVTDLGYELTLSSVWWTTAEVELVACTGLARRALDFLVPSAHAHGTASPTRLAAPNVENGFGAAETELGLLAPPAGRYCGLRYGLGPADADAQGLSAAPEMTNAALRISATFRRGAEQPRPFELVEALPASTDVPLTLELGADSPRATVRIERDATRWFDGVEFDASQTSSRQQVLENFMAAVRAGVE